MANVKISGLPAATSVTAGTDVAPLVSGGITTKATPQQIVNAGLAAPGAIGGTTRGTAAFTTELVGPSASANFTRFPNALTVISNTSAGIQQNETHNMGIMAEGTANAADTSIYGVGVYGVGYTASGTRCGGVIGEGHVSASADTGSAIGVRGYANDTHAGGLNIGLYGDCANGSSNYALYLNNGDIYTAGAKTWTLNGNLTFSGAYTVTVPTLSVSTTLSGTGITNYFASPPAIGSGTASTGAFTTLSASSTVSGTGFSTYLLSPPAIGTTAPAAGKFTDLTSTGNTTIGDASTDTFTVYPQTISLINSTSITAASTKTLTLNGGAGSNGLVIDSSNLVLIGTTSQGGAGSGVVNISYNNAFYGLRINTANSGAGSALQFNNSAGTQQGLIATTGLGTTTYGGTSDYRLKENIIPYTGALEVVSKLKPVKFKWIEGFEDNGFIAHELQEVLPNAVQGKKDAINTDGSINPQGIDPRCIVATLTAAIQELTTRLELLEAK